MRYLILSITLLLITSTIISIPEVYSNDVSEDITCTNDEGNHLSRIVSEEVPYGGYWYDDFNDNLGIHNISNLHYSSDGISLLREAFDEDFESYPDATDLTQTGNWTRHTLLNTGTFKADKSKPFGAISDTIGNHYNGDISTHSAVLTKKFEVEKGIFEYWVATNKIGNDDHSTTGIWLIGNDGDSPTSAERIVTAAFNYNGFQAYNGQWRSVVGGLSINTWYRVEISFDCAIEKLDILIYNSQGQLLGSLYDLDFENSFPSVKRIRLTTGPRNDGTYMNSYWDDLVVYEDAEGESGEIISNPIELPEGKKWSVLRIDKKEYSGSKISLTILDDSFSEINGLTYNPLNSEIDISSLNKLGVKSIRLKATFGPIGTRSPLLKGWGVEWNTTGIWSDQFISSLKTSSFTNSKIEDRSISLINQNQIGYVVSEKITMPLGYYWDKLNVRSTYQSPSLVSIDILDASTSVPINGFTNLNGMSYDLLDIDPIQYPSIKLRGKLKNDTTSKVSLESWSVDWTSIDPPEIISSIGPSLISNISTGQFAIDIDYPIRLVDQLTVDVKSKDGNEELWHDSYIKNIAINKTTAMWEFIFKPNSDTSIGSHSIKIIVTDPWNIKNEKEFTDLLQVYNKNDPPMIIGDPNKYCLEDTMYSFSPEVFDLDPEDFHTWTIDTNAKFLSIDQETGYIIGTPMNSDIGEYFVKVGISDSGGLTDALNFTITVININDQPKIMSEFPVQIFEDSDINFELEAVDIDPTKDSLIWTMKTNASFLSLKSIEGYIEGTPKNNDVGKYFLTLNVTDGQGGYDEVDSEFEVVNINDPPVIGSPPTIINILEDSTYSDDLLPNWFWDEDNDWLLIQHSFSEKIFISITDQNRLIIQPEKNWNGEETILLSATDGEFYVDWNVVIKVNQVNDAPFNISIFIDKTNFNQNEDIVLAGEAMDVDLEDGDQLSYLWFYNDRSPLGSGKIIKINLDPGDHIIILNVTDSSGVGLETTKTITVSKDETSSGKYGSLLIFSALILLSLIIVAIGIFIFKRINSKEPDETENDKDDESGETLGVANNYSSAIIGGTMVKQPELQPILTPSESLPPSSSPIRDPINNPKLPNATLPSQQSTSSVEYVRPDSEINVDSFKAPPSPVGIPVQSTQPVLPPPNISSVIDQIAREGEQITPPSDMNQTSTNAEFNSPIWSPEMVETRLVNDAKSAVDMLHELNELKNEGAITDNEYEIYKKRMLRKI